MSDSLYLHSPVVIDRCRSCPIHHNDSSHSSIESMTSPKNAAGLTFFDSSEKKHELNKECKSRGSLLDIHENEIYEVNDIGRDEDNVMRDNMTCVRSPTAIGRYRSCPVGSKPNISCKSQLLLSSKSADDLKDITTHVKCGSRESLHSQNLHIGTHGSKDRTQESSRDEDDSTREDSTACLRSPIALGGHQRNRSCPAQPIPRCGSDISSKFHLSSKSFKGLFSSVVKTRNRRWKKKISKARGVIHEKEEDSVSEIMTPGKNVSLPGVKNMATVVEDEDNFPDLVISDTDSVIKPPMQVNEIWQGTELCQSISDITDESTPSASSSDDSSNDRTYCNSSSESCSLSTQNESILTEYSTLISMSTREEGRNNEERMFDIDELHTYSSSVTSAFTGESKGLVSDSSKAFSVLTNIFSCR